jgi:DNA-directed RNA polymerase subunit M/transcription elongation factor TFIIS
MPARPYPTDNCPNCAHPEVNALGKERSSHTGETRHYYHCPDCGHHWKTSRMTAAYQERRP